MYVNRVGAFIFQTRKFEQILRKINFKKFDETASKRVCSNGRA